MEFIFLALTHRNGEQVLPVIFVTWIDLDKNKWKKKRRKTSAECIRTLVPKTDISGMDKYLHPTEYCVEDLKNHFFPNRPEAQPNSWRLGGRESLVIGKKKLGHFTESKTRILQYNRNSNKRKWPNTRTYWIPWLLMTWCLAAPGHQQPRNNIRNICQ